MNILFLDHPQHTLGTWNLWEGLARVLGSQSIIDYPYKGVFHGKPADLMAVQWYERIYEEIEHGAPLPQGIPSFGRGEPLTTQDERIIPLNVLPVEHATVSPQREHDELEIVQALDNGYFQLIVLGCSHRVPTIALARLRDRVKRPLPPIAYYDAGERDDFNAHWWHVFRPAVTFKQILTPEVRGAFVSSERSPHVPCRIYPLPLANAYAAIDAPAGSAQLLQVLGGLALNGRALDVVSWFGATWAEREVVQDRVRKVCRDRDLSHCLRILNALPIGVGAGLPYYAFLASSKVGVSMRGSGRDTDRYWQIPAMGAVLLSDGTMGCIHPFPFTDGVTASFYRSLDELEAKLSHLMEHETERTAIAAAGREHLRRFHTVEARALFFLGIVRKELGLVITSEQEDRVRFWLRRLEWPSELPEWEGPVVGYGDPA